MYYFRSEFEEGDQVIVHNIKKAKRLPGTKEAKKYIGPYSVENCTNICTNIFNTTTMIGNIGSVFTNLESSINRKLIPTKCKSCGSSDAICERLSGHFQTIPILLTVEIGHVLPLSKQVLISDIDQQFTISHHQQTLHYTLAGFSIFVSNHFYSLLSNNGQFYKYDGMRNPTVELWDCNHFIGSLNTVFYLLHSSD